MFIYILLVSLLNTFSIEDKLVKLNVADKDHTWIIDTITTYTKKIDQYNNDFISIVLSVGKIETDLKQTKKIGSAGEVGIMQVIPFEDHIKQLARVYRCTDSEVGTFYSLYGKKYPKCICLGSECNIPNIYYNKGKQVLVSTSKLRAFLLSSKRASLALGILELNYWRLEYIKRLKRIYWTHLPLWYAKRRNFSLSYFNYWWYKTKRQLKDNVWVVHYNYGSRFCLGRISRLYPRKVYKYYTLIH